MNNDFSSPLITIIFLVIVAILALFSMLTAFVFIRYGRKVAFTSTVTLVFTLLFIAGVITAYTTLQKLF